MTLNLHAETPLARFVYNLRWGLGEAVLTRLYAWRGLGNDGLTDAERDADAVRYAQTGGVPMDLERLRLFSEKVPAHDRRRPAPV